MLDHHVARVGSRRCSRYQAADEVVAMRLHGTALQSNARGAQDLADVGRITFGVVGQLARAGAGGCAECRERDTLDYFPGGTCERIGFVLPDYHARRSVELGRGPRDEGCERTVLSLSHDRHADAASAAKTRVEPPASS